MVPKRQPQSACTLPSPEPCGGLSVSDSRRTQSVMTERVGKIIEPTLRPRGLEGAWGGVQPWTRRDWKGFSHNVASVTRNCGYQGLQQKTQGLSTTVSLLILGAGEPKWFRKMGELTLKKESEEGFISSIRFYPNNTSSELITALKHFFRCQGSRAVTNSGLKVTCWNGNKNVV